MLSPPPHFVAAGKFEEEAKKMILQKKHATRIFVPHMLKHICGFNRPVFYQPKFFGGSSQHVDSILAQAGSAFDSKFGVTPPICLSTTFERDEKGELQGHMYSRLSNPTRILLEDTFARLESATKAMAFASGMAAVSSTLTACPGYHVILPDDLYHGVYVVAKDVMGPWGMIAEQIDMTDKQAVQAALLRVAARGAKKTLLWMESTSNPSCKVSDIKGISEMARALEVSAGLEVYKLDPVLGPSHVFPWAGADRGGCHLEHTCAFTTLNFGCRCSTAQPYQVSTPYTDIEKHLQRICVFVLIPHPFECAVHACARSERVPLRE